MNIVQFIKAKKIIFLRTIFAMENDMPIRRLTIEIINEYVVGDGNDLDSPLKQMLSYCTEFDLLDRVKVMASENVVSISKPMWKKLVWERAWLSKREHWDEYMSNNTRCDLIKLVTPDPMYSIW